MFPWYPPPTQTHTRTQYMISMFLPHAQVFSWVQMPPALPVSAATGGVTAALVSSLLRPDLGFPPGPIACQDLFREEPFLHWPSILVGIILGIFLAQILDLLYLLRQLGHSYLRQRGWSLQKASAVRDRIG